MNEIYHKWVHDTVKDDSVKKLLLDLGPWIDEHGDQCPEWFMRACARGAGSKSRLHFQLAL